MQKQTKCFYRAKAYKALIATFLILTFAQSQADGTAAESSVLRPLSYDETPAPRAKKNKRPPRERGDEIYGLYELVDERAALVYLSDSQTRARFLACEELQWTRTERLAFEGLYDKFREKEFTHGKSGRHRLITEVAANAGVTRLMIYRAWHISLYKADYYIKYLASPIRTDSIYDEPVWKLSFFSDHARRILRDMGIETVGQLCKKSYDDFKGIKVRGRVTSEIIPALRVYGLALAKKPTAIDRSMSGLSEYFGRDGFLEAFLEAKDIFGFDNVDIAVIRHRIAPDSGPRQSRSKLGDYATVSRETFRLREKAIIQKAGYFYNYFFNKSPITRDSLSEPVQRLTFFNEDQEHALDMCGVITIRDISACGDFLPLKLQKKVTAALGLYGLIDILSQPRDLINLGQREKRALTVFAAGPFLPSTQRAFCALGITTLGDLCTATIGELMAQPSMGEKKIRDVNRELSRMGLECSELEQANPRRNLTAIPDSRSLSGLQAMALPILLFGPFGDSMQKAFAKFDVKNVGDLLAVPGEVWLYQQGVTFSDLRDIIASLSRAGFAGRLPVDIFGPFSKEMRDAIRELGVVTAVDAQNIPVGRWIGTCGVKRRDIRVLNKRLAAANFKIPIISDPAAEAGSAAAESAVLRPRAVRESRNRALSQSAAGLLATVGEDQYYRADTEQPHAQQRQTPVDIVRLFERCDGYEQIHRVIADHEALLEEDEFIDAIIWRLSKLQDSREAELWAKVVFCLLDHLLADPERARRLRDCLYCEIDIIMNFLVEYPSFITSMFNSCVPNGSETTLVRLIRLVPGKIRENQSFCDCLARLTEQENSDLQNQYAWYAFAVLDEELEQQGLEPLTSSIIARFKGREGKMELFVKLWGGRSPPDDFCAPMRRFMDKVRGANWRNHFQAACIRGQIYIIMIGKVAREPVFSPTCEEAQAIASDRYALCALRVMLGHDIKALFHNLSMFAYYDNPSEFERNPDYRGHIKEVDDIITALTELYNARVRGDAHATFCETAKRMINEMDMHMKAASVFGAARDSYDDLTPRNTNDLRLMIREFEEIRAMMRRAVEGMRRETEPYAVRETDV